MKQRNHANIYLQQNINNKIYGRYCNDIIDENNQYCIDHKDKSDILNVKYDILAENICEHIISQKSRGKDRKGMKCGKFTFNSLNKKYCTDHVNRHKTEKMNEDKENETTRTNNKNKILSSPRRNKEIG